MSRTNWSKVDRLALELRVGVSTRLMARESTETICRWLLDQGVAEAELPSERGLRTYAAGREYRGWERQRAASLFGELLGEPCDGNVASQQAKAGGLGEMPDPLTAAGQAETQRVLLNSLHQRLHDSDVVLRAFSVASSRSRTLASRVSVAAVAGLARMQEAGNHGAANALLALIEGNDRKFLAYLGEDAADGDADSFDWAGNDGSEGEDGDGENDGDELAFLGGSGADDGSPGSADDFLASGRAECEFVRCLRAQAIQWDRHCDVLVQDPRMLTSSQFVRICNLMYRIVREFKEVEPPLERAAVVPLPHAPAAAVARPVTETRPPISNSPAARPDMPDSTAFGGIRRDLTAQTVKPPAAVSVAAPVGVATPATPPARTPPANLNRAQRRALARGKG